MTGGLLILALVVGGVTGDAGPGVTALQGSRGQDAALAASELGRWQRRSRALATARQSRERPLALPTLPTLLNRGGTDPVTDLARGRLGSFSIHNFTALIEIIHSTCSHASQSLLVVPK